MTQEIGLRVLVARRRLGATQREVAMAAGVSTFVLARLERGQRMPSLEILERITRAVRLPLDEAVRTSLVPTMAEDR